MIDKLISIATKLDKLGLTKEADDLNSLLVKYAGFNAEIARRRKNKFKPLDIQVSPNLEDPTDEVESDHMMSTKQVGRHYLSSAQDRLLTTALLAPEHCIDLRVAGDYIAAKKLSEFGLADVTKVSSSRGLMSGYILKLTDRGIEVAQQIVDSYKAK